GGERKVGRAEGGLDRRGDDRGDREHAGFADALGAERVQVRRRLEMIDLDRRDLVASRQRVVHEAGRERLPGRVVANLLEQRAAQAERHRAVDLALDDCGIDETSAVVAYPVARARSTARWRSAWAAR